MDLFKIKCWFGHHDIEQPSSPAKEWRNQWAPFYPCRRCGVMRKDSQTNWRLIAVVLAAVLMFSIVARPF